MSSRSHRSLVVGLGHADRGDDAVGSAVARKVEALRLSGINVVERDDPIRLLDAWAADQYVAVVAAVRSDDPPGTVTVRDLLSTPLPVTDSGEGSHAFDLAGTVDLGRSLGRLPARLVLVGVEAADLADRSPLSPRVLSAVDEAVRAVLAALGGDAPQ